MKSRILMSAAVSALACAALADSTVSDVIARQRWPWSETVDIDYTVTGDKGDVTFSATWDGQPTPVILGTDFQVEAGQHRFEWCPTNSYAGQTLTGFTVTAEAGSAADHKYLILDLVNGGYSFTNAAPAGGWTDEHKSTKMVFARCPAGTYENGMTYNRNTKCGDMTYVATGVIEQNDALFSYLYAQAAGKRTVTFTSDWYIGVFPMTVAQYEQVQNGSATSDYARKGISYRDLRGSEIGEPAINWPVTKYDVAETSLVGKMRAKAGGALCIDLPQEEQCETALRGGTATFWPSGGTASDSLAQLTNYANAVVNWYYGNGGAGSIQPVGMKAANGWGIYDIAGNGCSSWCLDTAYRTADRGYPSGTPNGGIDPVGSSIAPDDVSPYSMKRVVHGSGGYSAGVKLYETLPSVRYLYAAYIDSIAARFAIHLKPLNFGE